MKLPVERLIAVRAGNMMRERDPLSYYHFSVPRIREAMGLFAGPDPIEELLARGPNVSGKSTLEAAFGLSLAQKRPTLDGVRLPQWRGRVEVAQLVLDYKQQVLSVQPAYERMLGQWPAKARKGSGEAWESLRVMPAGGNPTNEHGWSVIHFLSQKNLTTGIGVRADAVIFDEPPVMAILRELRKAAHAGRQLCMLLGITPTIRRQWAPIQQDYGDTARRTLRRVDQERAEVRWSLDEVADFVLTPEAKARLIRKYVGDNPDQPRDVLAMARIHGDYCVTEGASPWGGPGLRVLEQMLALCTDPVEVRNWRLSQRDQPGKDVRFPVDIWEAPSLADDCVVTIDPSSGVEDNQHDPFDLEVTRRGTGDLLAQAGGYLPGYLVGVLAAGVARQYNGGSIDVEVNDRWGVNVVEGVHAAGYHRFERERRELRPGSGEFSNEIGFHNTGSTRPLIIGAIQQWLRAWEAGQRYGKCPSRKVIETLIDCILDADGKIVGAPGVHDECLIVRGQALRKCVRHRGMEMPEANPPVKTADQRLMEKLFGDDPVTPLPGRDERGLLYADRPRV